MENSLSLETSDWFVENTTLKKGSSDLTTLTKAREPAPVDETTGPCRNPLGALRGGRVAHRWMRQ